MREILFRGKKKPWGGWAEGSLVKMRDYYRISEKNDMISFGVETETIGQFIGLTDKNGKNIFEGDIIKHYNRDDDPTAFDVGSIFWDAKKCRWLRTSRKCDYFPQIWCSSAKSYEVIGNIHDNPELLEVCE